MSPPRRVASVLVMATLGVLATWVVSGGSPVPRAAGDLSPPEPLNGPYCGIYSLYHALRAIDVPVPFDSLAQDQYVGSGNGSSAEELRQAAVDHGAEALVLNGMTVATLRGATDPIILHVREPGHVSEYNHWVVFLGSEGDQARVIDGRSQVSVVPVAELLALWDGKGVVVARQVRAWDLASAAWVDAALVLFVGFLGVVVAAVVAGSPAAQQAQPTTLIRAMGRTGALFVLAAALGGVWHLVRGEGYFLNRSAIGLVAEHRLSPKFPLVSAEELTASMKRGEVLVIDARLPTDYQAGHIPGAVNVPISTGWLDRRQLLSTIPSSGRVVIYCQSEGCPWADTIALALISLGRSGVAVYRGGYQEWKRDGRASEPN